MPRTKRIEDDFTESRIFYFKPDDAEDLACVIAWVIDHLDEAREIVSRGRAVYLRHRWVDERRLFLTTFESLPIC